MQRGFCLPTPRHARHATSIASNAGRGSPAGETRRYGFNTSLAQRELRARGRNWVDGRIAECPRLQQKSSAALTTARCHRQLLVATSRHQSPTRSPRAGRLRASRHPATCSGPSSRKGRVMLARASAKRVVHPCLTTSRPQRSADLAEKQANHPLFFSARLA
jgi:hypothetical protein